MRTARLLLAISLSMGLGIAAAAAANPDLTTHRTSPNPVLWEIAEPAVSLPDFAQKLTADRRPADFEFRIDYTPDFVNINQLAHHSVDVEKHGPVRDRRAHRGRARSCRDCHPGPQPQQPPPGGHRVRLAQRPTGHDSGRRAQHRGQLRSVVHRHRGDRGLDPGVAGRHPDPLPRRRYRVLGCQRQRRADVRDHRRDQRGLRRDRVQRLVGPFRHDPVEILFFQQTLGRILDLESPQRSRGRRPPLGRDLHPLGRGPPRLQPCRLARLADLLGSRSPRGSIPRDFTDEFDPAANDFEFDLPGLTAGFRLTDIEYYYIFDFSFGFDAFIKADGTFVDAATPAPVLRPRRVRCTPRRSDPCSPPSAARSTWPRSAQTPDRRDPGRPRPRQAGPSGSTSGSERPGAHAVPHRLRRAQRRPRPHRAAAQHLRSPRRARRPRISATPSSSRSANCSNACATCRTTRPRRR
jgi:hypothetical protein